MKFNKETKQLYSSEGVLLKTLSCPKNVSKQDLEQHRDKLHFQCKYCDQVIYDTAKLSEREIEKLLQENPFTCLKISSNQPNITIL